MCGARIISASRYLESRPSQLHLRELGSLAPSENHPRDFCSRVGAYGHSLKSEALGPSVINPEPRFTMFEEKIMIARWWVSVAWGFADYN